SLAQYQEAAYAAIGDIQSRRKLPLLVGGTGQYITAVVEGWSIPQVEPNLALREELEAVAATEGNQALHARLQVLDPEYAEKIHPNNVRRVIRALEVCLTTGDTMTNLQRKQPPPYVTLTIGLQMEREKLYARADQRLDMMIKSGFVEEVRGLIDMGYARDLPAMSAVGYVEVLRHLYDDEPLDEVITVAKNNTHDFIRKQEIWFRGHDHGILWHNVDYADSDTIVQEVKTWRE
ncbi:MAG: tRNA (adenosine(37)-N6)-dimethylallyltransferase MiaA, partial [Anaerolineae bacterium]|nr:tRNA (adenosine(37)-N6)-dimethylallyltransferase MiaA [Anaerolineae bacterium]